MEINPAFIATQLITLICAVLASSGLWAFLQNRADKKDASDDKQDAANELLTGLAHDRIIELGTSYLERGFITQDEYENLYEYLYKPYHKMGANGSGDHMLERVNRLPIKSIEHAIVKREADS